MSEVTGQALAQVMAKYDLAYLLTVNADGRPHAVAVRPQLDGDELTLPAVGTRSRGNIGERPQVSLLWPPAEVDGHSLIVNGTAREGQGASVVVVPDRAVRHRPHEGAAPEGSGSAACDADCLAVDLG